MTQLLDIIGAIFSILSTWLSIQVNPLTWPVGLISLGIDLFLYSHKGLYADLSLHLIYLAMTFYGWYQWQHGGPRRQTLAISSLTPRAAMNLGLFTLAGILTLCTILHYQTDSQVPLWDASTTVLSLVAEWLLCKKIIQCWGIWFIVDALFAGLYAYKGLPAHALVNAGYVIMAMMGYLSWRQKLARANGGRLATAPVKPLTSPHDRET